MSAFGVGAYSSVLSLLVNKLSSFSIKHYGYLCDVEDKLKSLKRTVLGIDSLAVRAEMLHVRDPVLDIWLTDLKDVACDAEDLIEDFAIMVNDIDGENQNLDDIIENKVMEAMNRYNIGKKIEEIQKRLATIASERSGLGLANPPPQPQIQMRESRTTTSVPLPSESCVFGRDDDRKNMVRMLLEPSRDVVGAFRLPVIPIVGMGGIGKTTLARAVFNDPKVEKHFIARAVFNDPEVEKHFKDLRIWVYVSEDLNVRRITEEIFEAACGKKPSSIGSLDILQRELKSELTKKMFLLVLDDVWTEDYKEWDRLFAPLNSGMEGSKVVITTRSMKVADIIGTIPPLSLRGLLEPHPWDLFKARAFVKSCCDEHPGLEKIGVKIVKRLGGVPLAVNTIGGLCSSNLDENAWKSILDSEIWTLPQLETDITPVLRLSYQQMPAHLKLCFTFCSIFPKGWSLRKDTLVALWMAHGFVQPHPQERRPIEDIGGEYFDDLVCRSFFQKKYSFPYNHSMHDLMHDLAQSISAEECVIINDHNIKQKIPEKVRHLSLNLHSSFEFEDLYKLKSLRTLAYFRKPSGFDFSHDPRELFKNLKYLRVLHLSDSGIEELPDSIGLLKHLRHLNLSFTPIRSLPREVGDLCNLQTMWLTGCKALHALPESINKLTNLRSFYGEPGLLSKLVGIGNLKSLQKLEKFKVSRETGHKVGELKELTKLRGGLIISQLENVISEAEANDASLTNKQYLTRLVLEWGAGDQRENESNEKVLEGLKPHPNIKDLEIKCNDGINFPSWLADQYLSNLEDLTLENCRRWKVLPRLGQLSSLKYLRIKGMAGVEKLHPAEIMDKGFPSLCRLWIYDCPKLSVLPTLPPTLKMLEIKGVGLRALPRLWGCNETSSSASASTSSPSSALSKLIITSCPELTSLREGLMQQHLSSLNKLVIEDCPQIPGFFFDLPALKDLRISGYAGLSTLGIQALNSLEYLDVQNCPKLTSLTNNREGLQNFTPLKTIRIHDCASFESMPAGLHHLSSLHKLFIKNCPRIQGSFSDLPALKDFRISGCAELSTLGIQALNPLDYLDVQNCPKLTSLTNNREGLQNFTPLKTIRIHDCASFESMPAGLHHLSSLHKLFIQNCPRIQGSFSDLPALKDLSISGCEELSTLGIQALNSLAQLYVNRCPKLTSLTDNREGLQNFIPLKNIMIHDCASFESMPAGLHHLSSLHKLFIQNCPRIQGSFSDLPALKDLRISGCGELSTLEIQALNSLEYLDVQKCPKLTSLTNNREGLQNFTPLKTIRIHDCASFESMPAGLHHLSSLHKLFIKNCPRIQGSFSDLPALKDLRISGCAELSTLGIQALNSLEYLDVQNCPKLTSLTNNREGLQNFIPLKTIMIHDCASFESMPAGLHHLSSLHKLFIKNCPWIQGSFSDLPALKDLCISGCEELSTMEIQALNSLEYLDVQNCPKLTSLTNNREGLQNFIPLKTIKIHDCASFESMPAGLHHLSSLHKLFIKNCPRIQGSFSDLPALKDLSISGCEELSTMEIQALNSLEYLDVQNCPKLTSLTNNREGLQNFIPLKTIKIHDCASFESMPAGLHHLSSLHKLFIKNCPRIQGSFSDLPALKDLSISGCEELSTLGIQALNSLAQLYVNRCPKLTSLTDNREGLQNFIPLKTIMIHDCASFGSMPAGLHHLSSLHKLFIKNCPRIQGSFSDLPALKYLSISGCEELSTLEIQALNSLEYLDVQKCPKLTSLTNNREGLQNFIPLKTIKIHDCASFESMPAGLHHLSSLHKLFIKNCPRIQGSFSDLPALKDLSISGCEELSTMEIQALNSLEYLDVQNCPKLTSLTNNREGLQNFIPLKTIKIHDCASFGSMPAGLHHLSSLHKLFIKNCPRIQGSFSDLPALKDLSISGCEELSTLGIQALNSLAQLYVNRCPKLTSLTDNREGLQNFIPLKTIMIHDCASFESMPVGLRHLSSLHKLFIKNCPRIHGSFSDLPALKDLSISGCEELSTLGIQALNFLKKLVVESCPRLASLTESAEGLQNFIPLHTIEIRDCASFERLPAGLHHLSSLKKLVIKNCPQIQSSFPELPASLQIFDIN